MCSINHPGRENNIFRYVKGWPDSSFVNGVVSLSVHIVDPSVTRHSRVALQPSSFDSIRRFARFGTIIRLKTAYVAKLKLEP